MASESDKTPLHILVIKAILARITDPILFRQQALLYALLRLVTPMLGLPHVRVDVGFFENVKPIRAADTKDIGDRNLDFLVTRDLNPSNTCHTALFLSGLSLALLVPRLAATDDADDPFALDQPAVFTARLD